MQRIESPLNPRLKRLRKLATEGYRQRWIIEGRKLFEDALASGVKFEEIFVTSGSFTRIPVLRKLDQGGVTVCEVPASLMKQISRMDTPPGLLAVAAETSLNPPAEIAGFASLLLSVRDPGNMGTLIRSAEAAGCEFLACSADSAEPRQPKVVRASMGSIFRVPAFKVPNAEEYVRQWKMRGVHIYALYPRGGTPLQEIKPRYPALILIGGEGAGIQAEMEIDQRITIKMKGKVESLNTAMAGTLCFYHFQRAEG